MVTGYEGRPGAGKTLTAAYELFRLKERGRPVYANIPLVDRRQRMVREYFFFGKLSVRPFCPRTYGRSWADGMVNSIDEVLALDNATVLLDEVHMWMGSEAWNSISFEVRRYLAQQRKRGIDIIWTAQSNARVFNVIRELTAILYSCQRYGPIVRLEGSDPQTKEAMGKRWRIIGPGYFNIYTTEYEVGDGKGVQGQIHTNKRYEGQRQALAGMIAKETRREIPSYAVLDREEELGGRVVLSPGGEAWRWWVRQRTGAGNAVPHPLAAATVEGQGPATVAVAEDAGPRSTLMTPEQQAILLREVEALRRLARGRAGVPAGA